MTAPKVGRALSPQQVPVQTGGTSWLQDGAPYFPIPRVPSSTSWEREYSAYLVGSDPFQGWGLKNPGFSPPDPTRTSTTEAQPNLSCEDSLLENRQAWAPRHLGRGTSPPLLIHLQYEEVWGTLPGREHRPGEVTARVLPQTSIFWATARGQASKSPAGWSESLCSPGGAPPPLIGAECQTCTGSVWFICSRMSWILQRIFFWCPAKVTPILSRSLETEKKT